MTFGWSSADWAPLLIVIPLFAALLDFTIGRPARAFIVAVGVPAMLIGVVVLAANVYTGGTQLHAAGGWTAPLGIALRADGLSALMLLMTAVVGAGISVYALAYFDGDSGQTYFWPLWWFLWAALNALFLSADIFNLYVTLELLGLAAVGLVALTGDAAALRAALRYFFATLIGSLSYLLGVALLYGEFGTLTIAELAQRMAPSLPAVVALALMTGGMMLKTALFPLHFWLPPAHGGAPSPVSAALSGLVSKASFYLMLRLWFEIYAPGVSVNAAQFVGALGATAILWGGWLALRQRRLKMLVAWSTVAQIGYLFLLFPLVVGTGSIEGWQGGIYQALSHALAKAAMFLAAGCLVLAMGEDDIDRLKGIGARLPIVHFAFGIAGVSLMGLPPSGGFIAKWLLLQAAISTGQWWWVVPILLGGLLTAAYLFRVLRHAFLPLPEGARLHAVPHTLQLASFVLALLSLALGVNASGAFALLAVGAPQVVAP